MRPKTEKEIEGSAKQMPICGRGVLYTIGVSA